jgi:phage tail sheath gpL-like
MAVSFNSIPGNLRVPLFYAEVNSGGAPYQSNARLLLVGQMLSTGSATEAEPILTQDNGDALFGPGSMLAEMCRIARVNAPFQEIWALPLADADSGVAASGKIAVADTPVSAAGTLTLYIAGVRLRIRVATTDDDDAVAAALVAAINAVPSLPVTAAVNGSNANECDLTARHAGTLGNDIRIDTDLIGDESTLASDLLTITAMASGSGDPDITTALAALGDEEYDWIASAYADTANLDAAEDFLNGDTGRWGPISQLYGHTITFKAGALGALSTLGLSRNDPHASVMGAYNSPSPAWSWAAAIGGRAAAHLQDAPELSRPLHTLPLVGIVAPKIADRFGISERNTALYDGISTYHVRRDGTVCIDRLITTYQTNAWESPDATWLDVNTMAQTMYMIRYLRTKVTSTYGRVALADENPFGLQGIATPEDIEDTITHGYVELVADGVLENSDLFEAELIVERDTTDANRVNVYLPYDVVNQLRIFAVNATTFLQLRSPAAA